MIKILKKIILICIVVISIFQAVSFANNQVLASSKEMDNMKFVVKIRNFATTKYTIEVDTGEIKQTQKGYYDFEHKFDLSYDKSTSLNDRKIRIKMVLPSGKEKFTREYSFEEISYNFEEKAYYFELDMETMQMIPTVQVVPMIGLIRFALFTIIITLVMWNIIKKYKNKKLNKS